MPCGAVACVMKKHLCAKTSANVILTILMTLTILTYFAQRDEVKGSILL